MTSATEVLRHMLDERGVEWWQKKRHTCWKVGKGQEVEMWRAWEAPDGSLTLKVDYIYQLTPEQAIAATLGATDAKPTQVESSGTCHDLVHVVRCRDCKYCMSYWKSDYCDYFSHVTNDPDGFCAWGERKESE